MQSLDYLLSWQHPVEKATEERTDEKQQHHRMGGWKNKLVSEGGMVSQRVNLFRVAWHLHWTHSGSCSSPFPGLVWSCFSCSVADSLLPLALEQEVVELQSK